MKVSSNLMLLVGLLLFGQSVHAQSLSEAIKNGLELSPSVRKSVHQALSTSADIKIANSARLPKITADGSAGAAYRDRSIDGAATGSGDTLFSRRLALTLQQLLFDWGASGRFVQSAKKKAEFERLLVLEEREQEALAITETFLDVIRLRLHDSVLKKGVTELSEFQEKAKNDGDSGIGPSVLLEGRIAVAEANVENNKALLGAIENRYYLLVGQKPGTLSLPAMPRFQQGMQDHEYSWKYAAAQKGIEASKMQMAATKRDWRPKFFVELRGGLGHDVSGISGPDNEWSGLLVLRWTPYEGGKHKARLEKADAEIDKQKAILMDVQRAVEDQVGNSLKKLDGAKARTATLEKGVVKMGNALETFKKDQTAKALTIAQLSSERVRAQTLFINAKVDQYKAAYAALAASGALLEFQKVSTRKDSFQTALTSFFERQLGDLQLKNEPLILADTQPHISSWPRSLTPSR